MSEAVSADPHRPPSSSLVTTRLPTYSTLPHYAPHTSSLTHTCDLVDLDPLADARQCKELVVPLPGRRAHHAAAAQGLAYRGGEGRGEGEGGTRGVFSVQG